MKKLGKSTGKESEKGGDIKDGKYKKGMTPIKELDDISDLGDDFDRIDKRASQNIPFPTKFDKAPPKKSARRSKKQPDGSSA